jgi:hypothetical protein
MILDPFFHRCETNYTNNLTNQSGRYRMPVSISFMHESVLNLDYLYQGISHNSGKSFPMSAMGSSRVVLPSA